MKLALATESDTAWELPYAGKVGMWGVIAAESAIFVIFIVAYAFYIGKSTSGPTTAILHTPIFLTVCLLSSSATMELALRGLRRGDTRAFSAWWFVTLGLAATFLGGTLLEWRHLIVDEGLTIHTNLFGTTYYSLVGLHAFHVLVGLTLMAVVAAFIIRRRVTRDHTPKLEVISLYWHFVDVVWVAVFTLVYVVGR
ncbi:MAG TPA: cytochrome c oxidase subunit 3 [Haliangiales bacterium]|nr:cytochrome c oxidase subunit 3 [Haliangiales bacterium]